MTITFPLCTDADRDVALRPIVEQAITFLLDRVRPDQLEGVILTGSLARGEGSVLVNSTEVRLLGDIEFLVIVRPPFNWPEVRRKMAELGMQATDTLGNGGRLVTIEYGPAGMSYLQRAIRPCIFAYDLRHHGKVVWGPPNILEEIQPFAVDAIPQEDALELVMNRMVELLLLDAGTNETLEPGQQAYQIAKVMLDLAGSALAFAGRYVSRYSERLAAFQTLMIEDPSLTTLILEPQRFLAELALATQCKRSPTTALLNTENLTERLPVILAWTKRVWIWEMQRLIGNYQQQFPELLENYLCREALADRFKGWIKYYQHPLRPSGARDLFHLGRLLCRASPRRLAYAAALLAHEGKVTQQPEWEYRAAALLPVAQSRGTQNVVQQIGEFWRWFVRNN